MHLEPFLGHVYRSYNRKIELRGTHLCEDARLSEYNHTHSHLAILIYNSVTPRGIVVWSIHLLTWFFFLGGESNIEILKATQAEHVK